MQQRLQVFDLLSQVCNLGAEFYVVHDALASTFLPL
jgi:hypothetical protein